MAVALSHDWRCLQCQYQFYDPTDRKPCPQCGNAAGDLLEAVQSATVAQARGVMGAATKAAPTKAKAAHRRSLLPWDRVPAFLLGVFLLLIWWAFGAKYTIDGLPLLVNLFAGWFHLPVQLAPISDGTWYLRLAWLPILISFVERQYQPWRRRDILSRKAYWLLLTWLAVIAIDFGSTYLAIRSPAGDAWPLTITIATVAPLAIGWSLLTTFGPESGLSWLWRWLRSA